MATQATAVAGGMAEGQTIELRRALGPWHLIALGIGAIIGAGIFVITGQAAAQYAGPGIVISFVIAGVGCVFAGLCYAEFASMIPVSGSAYTYTYATLGRFMGWVIGWDLVLEYLAAAGAVSVGWSAYFVAFMKDYGITVPAALSSAPVAFDHATGFVLTGAVINVPAVVLVVFLSTLLIVGIRASAGVNNLMVLIKVVIVLAVILFGLPLIKMENLTPFIPENTGQWGHYGWSGVLRASGVIFFAYIGFDAVSVAAQEARNPQRDMPIGILGSLAICTVLYILMALTVTGLAHYSTLGVAHPVSFAIEQAPSIAWLEPFVNIAAVMGLATVVLVLLYGQSRIFFAMANDGLLPPLFAAVHPQFRTPYRGTLVTMVFAALLGGVLPLSILGELVSIGTLAAFVLVSIGVMVLRWTRPNVKRPFRTPLVPIVPLLSIFVCGAMMVWLPGDTWIRLAVWFFIGLVIYAFYGSRHAKAPRFTLEDEPAKS